MSERKVLNKYYPPDFDPSKIPKGKRARNSVFNIRIMAPFNMRCNMCKEYIYKGKKFNSRKENVEDEYYLGLRIFRFYIKCPRCVSEIAFKTDLKNTDYALEAGATRLFEAEKLAQQMAEKEQKEKEEDDMNPMKVLENRTKASRQEMDQIDSLEELREINSKKAAVNTEEMLELHRRYEEMLQKLQMEQEEQEIREIFGEGGQVVKRIHDSDSDSDEPPVKKPAQTSSNPTDILAQDTSKETAKPRKPEVWEKSVGGLSTKQKLSGLVKKKTTSLPTEKSVKPEQSTSQSASSSTTTNHRTESDSPTNQAKSDSLAIQEKNSSVNVCSDVKGDGQMSVSAKQTSAEEDKKVERPQASSLGLLGAYADSDDSESSD